ncbi:LysR substrate-binding domain-containing protein [Acidisphaera sp. L21]|uniref:LysR substrate-binding domain-containing protein n=1 Tax=Acidisphaera sp. L21 TaxID=1641851 RepID=UPI001C208A19|nr:LysR substrate-binding domain-containing protein [Acidisphaera sp. L21]
MHAFEVVARHTTFAQGAVALCVTPSAVSHQIQQLEDFLGVQLFRREAGRAVLTAAGHLYAQQIRNAFGLMADATALVAPQSQSGHLVIASSPSFAAKWLQPRLPDFLSTHPGLEIRVSTLSGSDTFNKDRCDIAIVYGRPPAQAQAASLLAETLRPLCSPAVAEALALAGPRALAGATLIHSVNALTWTEYLRKIGHGDIRPHNEIWLDRSTIAIDAAVAGMGVVLESELLAEQELRDGRLVAPFESAAFGVQTESYFLVRPPGSHNHAQAARFEAWLLARNRRPRP